MELRGTMKSENLTQSVANNWSTPLGFLARNLRLYLDLSQKELAKIARVSPESVDLFEHNQPLPLDEKRKILKELYQRKARKFG